MSTKLRPSTDRISVAIASRFVVSFFRGKAINGKKNYIMNWLGKMSEEAVSHDPINLIPELVRGFQQHIQIKDYHKKSVIHQFVK